MLRRFRIARSCESRLATAASLCAADDGPSSRAWALRLGAVNMRAQPSIHVERARTNNLRDVTVDIVLEKCTVLVGPSGSGKTSLAFDTIHAAAHAAYLEGISSYARFAESRLTQPDVDRIDNLRPTVALGQGYGGRSSRSTVGTATDASALLRLLFSRFGSPPVSAGSLSFNNTNGACLTCEARGLAVNPVVDRLLDCSLSLEQGAIRHRTWRVGGRYWNILAATGRVRLDVPVGELTGEEIDFLLYEPPLEVSQRGAGFIQKASYEGLISRLLRRLRDRRDGSRDYDRSFVDELPCPNCNGTRLSEQARNVRIGTTTFGEVMAAELTDVQVFVASIQNPLASPIIRRLVGLLDRILGMGLGYLTLARGMMTLSGGELQRVKIANEVSSPLAGLVYVIDEASAGLHFAESQRMYDALRAIGDRGNTLVLVDHAPGALAISNRLIEMGPGGGRLGGEITWQGPTSEYSGVHGRLPHVGRELRPVSFDGPALVVKARSHNLHPATVPVPVARLVVLAGPSGSGKSSLAGDIAAQCEGTALLSQRDIGATSRSVISTYLGVHDHVRKLYARTSGRSSSDFTFNGAGACPTCGGTGVKRIEMQFLEDVVEVCDECEGRRFAPDVLTSHFDGLNIAEVLALTLDEAAVVFADQPAITRPVNIARAVGMGHLVLGQGSDTLSGGEAQRLRISAEISSRTHRVLILDEPTRGLGHNEVQLFVELVDTLLDEDRTIVAIEHHLSVIEAADWVIELGPGAGAAGGRIVASGPPETLIDAGTLTGRTLADFRATVGAP